MKCPHCTVVVHLSKSDIVIGDAKDEDRNKTIRWHTAHAVCPHCEQRIIWLSKYGTMLHANGVRVVDKLIKSYLVWPQSTERPIPTEVPADIRGDFNEAARVLPISPQASAALTRRILQQVLRDYGKTKSKDLADQIDETIAKGHIPAPLSEQLDVMSQEVVVIKRSSADGRELVEAGVGPVPVILVCPSRERGSPVC